MKQLPANILRLRDLRVKDIKGLVCDHNDGLEVIFVRVIFTPLMNDIQRPNVRAVVEHGHIVPRTEGAGWNKVSFKRHGGEDSHSYYIHHYCSDKYMAQEHLQSNGNPIDYWFLLRAA